TTQCRVVTATDCAGSLAKRRRREALEAGALIRGHRGPSFACAKPTELVANRTRLCRRGDRIFEGRRQVMRLRVVFIALLAVLALAATAGANPDPSSVVTDDPAEQVDAALGLDGSGISSVERYLGNQTPADANTQESRNVSLVRALQLSPFTHGRHGDVAGYKNLAFVGKWRGARPGTPAAII